jgi:hypothetical protein
MGSRKLEQGKNSCWNFNVHTNPVGIIYKNLAVMNQFDTTSNIYMYRLMFFFYARILLLWINLILRFLGLVNAIKSFLQGDNEILRHPRIIKFSKKFTIFFFYFIYLFIYLCFFKNMASLMAPFIVKYLIQRMKLKMNNGKRFRPTKNKWKLNKIRIFIKWYFKREFLDKVCII